MHRGEDTEFYLKKGFRVVGFEADPELVRGCRERFADALRDGRLHIVEGAIVEGGPLRSGRVRFYRNLDASVWGTAEADWMRRNAAFGARSIEIEVPAVDFAAGLARHGVPHYLKIDIEGADLVCLRALQTMEDRPDYVSLESDKVSFAALQAEFDLLEQLGYREFQLVQQATVPRRAPPRPPREGADIAHVFPYGSSGLFGAELAGPWLSRSAALRRYRAAFLAYRLFGDRSALLRSSMGHRLIQQLSRLAGRDVPGWYDTHARR